MKRSSRISVSSRPALLGAVIMLALTSASVAAADDGRGPLGVTVVTGVSRQSMRVGALFGTENADDLAGHHFCTASVVHSPQGNLIATAAHCVGGTEGDRVFVPGYRDGKAPYGVWKVTKRFMPDAWSSGEDEDSDVAFAYVEELDGGGRRIEDVVGANRFAAGTVTGATPVTLTGYPSSLDVPIRCTNKPGRQSPTQQRIDCPAFTSGTSGSPWVNGSGQLVGVLGGHERGGSTPDVSYSVAFGRPAAELYADATSDS